MPEPPASDNSHEQPPAKPVTDEDEPDTESDSPGAPGGSPDPHRASPPTAGRRVSPNVHFTPEQFLEVEQVKKRMEAQCGRRLSWSRFFYELCRNPQPARGGAPRINTMGLVHVNADSGQAWTETERGNVPVSDAVVAEAMAAGHVAVVGEDVRADSTEAASHTPHLEQPAVRPVNTSDRSNSSGKDRTSPRPHSRPALSASLMRSLFLRARGRCEMCGGRGPLHVDHINPWDDHPVHEFAGLQVLCIPCHVVKHDHDFEHRKHWRAAKARRMASRHATREASQTVGAGIDSSR